jgi:7-cyano-7-deazaguanine synthase
MLSSRSYATKHTCYEGNHETRHDWGYGCGACPACELRRVGYEVYAGEERTDERGKP